MFQGRYWVFFGLSKRPFTLTPDPEFLFLSPQHSRALAVLEFGVLSQAPITLITGDVGSGKTTLLHALLRQVSDDVQVGLVANASGDRNELLHWVTSALGIDCADGDGYVQQFRRLQEHLVAEYAAGRRVVLIFDEAQNLSGRALEDLRMFTNINANRDELLQLILIGQPELRDRIRANDMRQLAQRVAAGFHLSSLDATSTEDLIRHRLRVAGGTGDEVSPDAARAVFNVTAGVPRLINQLCDLAMFLAWGDGQDMVSEETISCVLENGAFFGGGVPEREAC